MNVVDDKIGLGEYVERDVVLQLKQPYQFQMVRSAGGKPALMLFRQDGQRLVAADLRDKDAIPVAFGFLIGRLRKRESGHFYVVTTDETSGSSIEVAVNPELIAFVSAVVTAPTILRP